MTPTGRQVRIEAGDYAATSTEVGGGLRDLTYRGRSLVSGFGEDEIRAAYRGSVLAPWPNRVVDGRYAIDGVEFLLPHTEPERGHALHGLVCWDRWQGGEVGADRCSWRLQSVPQPWYPWALTLAVTYRLDADAGLGWQVSARNDSADSAPVGLGVHPYFVLPAGVADDWHVVMPAGMIRGVDGPRLIPGERVAFDGVEAPIGLRGKSFDNAFTDLAVHRAALVDDVGHGIEVTWGETGGWVQVYTGDGMPHGWHRRAVAIEPMTCGPNAFNDPAGPPLLAPGESLELSVAIRVV